MAGQKGGGPGHSRKRSRDHQENGHSQGFRNGAHDARVEIADGSSSGDEGIAVIEPGGSAYDALLSSLSSSAGTYAEVYAQRRREEEGGSDRSEDEDEEGDEDVGEEEDGSEGEELDGSEEEEEEGDDGDEGGEEGDSLDEDGVGDDDDEGLSLSEEGGDEEEDAGEGKGDGDGVGRGNESEGRRKKREEVEDETDSDEERRNTGGAAGTSQKSPFEVHIGRELQEADVSMLQAAKVRFKVEVQAGGVLGGKWVTDQPTLPDEVKDISELAIKSKLLGRWKEIHEDGSHGGFDSDFQAQFFSLCNTYRDVLHVQRRSLDGRIGGTEKDGVQLMDAYILHTLNHIVRTRDLVVKNNEKLAKHSAAEGSNDADNSEFVTPRDQGFTRPKVLFLLPFRNKAFKLVERLLRICPPSQAAQVENWERFVNEFTEEDSDEEDEDAKKGKAETAGEDNGATALRAGKPADHTELFEGNIDDHFRLGIKLTRKSVKLYSDFYSSDIIVASPIGLITRIGEAESDKERDMDFLSSVEVAVVDWADVIYMQNWQHVLSVFEYLNQIPAKPRAADFMRVREWYLNSWARHYRQTIIVSAFANAEINALFHRHCVNHAGKVKLLCEYSGVLSTVLSQVRQVYERVECSAITEADDARFEYFTKHVFPRIKDSMQGGMLIFFRSYFDFVRVRNFLKAQAASFCLLGEYTKTSDVSRARSWFFHGKRRIMLYTERAHFYHRFRIRGIRDVIFYSLPEYSHTYPEILNLLEGKENPTCSIIFSKFDKLELERIVGTARAKRMLTSQNRTFMFC